MATPISASGNRMLRGWKPNTLALSAGTQRANGGLSTDTMPPGSNETNRKLCQESSIERTPAE